MRKLYKLKEWYSLEDAAHRLTLTLGEPVDEKDILQLCVEGHLPLSWYMRHVPAQEVAPVTHILNFDETFRKMAEKAGRPFTPRGTLYSEGYKTQSDLITYLDGVHKLELNLCGAMKDWILSLVTNTGGELISLEGYFASDSYGRLWRIMEHWDSVYLAKMRESMSPEKKERDARRPINHEDYYYPSGGSPDVEDLGITKTDLESFEAKLVEMPKQVVQQPLRSKERDSLLKLVIGMAVDAYGYDPKASRSPAPREIAGHLEGRGLKIDEDTVRKWLNEAKEAHDASLTADA